MTPFNARVARAKRPCPVWVDAFQRDTQHLQADEVGAYFLILMAMWTRESCDFPDDDSRLARVSRVSTRLWKSRIGPVIREFLTVEDGAVISKRLREEAAYVEGEVQKQSDRKRGTYAKPTGARNSDDENGEKPCKPLKYNDPPSTADTSTDRPRTHPSQQPNNPTVEKEEPNGSSKKKDDVLGDRFQEFWDAYPHRGGQKKNRKGAEEKFRAAIKRGVTADKILAGVGQMLRFPDVQQGYARDPVTWLNQQGWEDIPPTTPPPQARGRGQWQQPARPGTVPQGAFGNIPERC